MDDSGVESIQKLGVVGLHPLRRQASDTNLTSADYSGRAAAKPPGGVGAMQSAGGGGGAVAGKRSKSPFAIFRRPKTQDQSPIRAGDMPGGDSLPMHITVSSSGIFSRFPAQRRTSGCLWVLMGWLRPRSWLPRLLVPSVHFPAFELSQGRSSQSSGVDFFLPGAGGDGRIISSCLNFGGS